MITDTQQQHRSVSRVARRGACRYSRHRRFIRLAQEGGQQPGGGIQQEKTVPVIASGKWTGKRLPDGQPDIAGHWSNTIANHNNWTDPQGGVINDPARRRRARAAQ